MLATLKPPPAFATNGWAWSYTLNKLDERGNLDEGGNPKNYAAACAIYKRVVAKYSGDIANLPSVTDFGTKREATRAQILRADVGRWTTGHGMAWGANLTTTARMYFSSGYQEAKAGDNSVAVGVAATFRVELTGDAGVEDDFPVELATASWMFRNSPAALAWLNEAANVGVADLHERLAEATAGEQVIGGVSVRRPGVNHDVNATRDLLNAAAAALSSSDADDEIGEEELDRRFVANQQQLRDRSAPAVPTPVKQTSKRAYHAMGDAKLADCLRELRAGHGPQFDKTNCPEGDLEIVERLANERGLA